MAKTGRIFNMSCRDEWTTREVVKRYDEEGNEIKKYDDEGNEVVEYEEVKHYLNEEKIREALERHTSLKEWCYIHHTDDLYTEEEAQKADPPGSIKVGEIKPPHWHIVARSNSGLNVEMVAGWFGFASNFIQVPKGGNRAFLDCVQYLTHESDKEQAKGKTLYSDEAVQSNFDWRAALDNRDKELKELGFEPRSEKSKVRAFVSQAGKPLSWVRKHYPEAYNMDFYALKSLRRDYIRNTMPLPPLRLNFYISGDSGMGKSSLSALLALALWRSFEPEGEDWAEDEVYFTIGGPNVRFQQYEGQPIIIWEEMRASQMIYEFGRGEIFTMFDPRPKNKSYHIKNGDIVLKNAINIVNGIETFDEFIGGLVGEYTDKDGVFHKGEEQQILQGMRRFPFFIEVDKEFIDLYVSKGWLDDTQEFSFYKAYKTIGGNMKQLVEQTGDEDRELRIAGGQKYLGEVVDTYNVVKEKHIKKQPDKPDFSEFGKVIDVEKPDWHFGDETRLKEKRAKQASEPIEVKPEIMFEDDDDLPY